jgi:hypothetical protein
MKNELEMKLFSRRFLTESIVRQQITALSDFSGGLMRTDKCDEGDRKTGSPAPAATPTRMTVMETVSANQMAIWPPAVRSTGP